MYWMNADPSTVSLSCQEESRCDWKDCDVVAHMPEMYAHRHALTHVDTCTDQMTKLMAVYWCVRYSLLKLYPPLQLQS